MKKYILVTFVLILNLFLFGCTKKQTHYTDLEIIRQRGYLIAGVKTDSAPFGYYDKKGKLRGVDIDIAKQIANNIFRNDSPDNIKFVPVIASNKIAKLNSKEVDILVATMSINQKRRLVVNFSRPYFAANQKLMVKKNSKIASLRYFETKGKLGTIIGTTGEKTLRLVAPNAYVVGVKTYPEAKKLLKTNKVDAIFGDDCILYGLNDGDFKIVNRAYSRELYGVAVRKSPDSADLLNIIDETIAEMLDDKKIDIKKEIPKKKKAKAKAKKRKK